MAEPVREDRLRAARLLHDTRFGLMPVHNGGSAPFEEPVVPCDWCITRAADFERAGFRAALAEDSGEPALDVERLYEAMPTTETEWRPFWHRVDEPDGWVVSIYGGKLAEQIAREYAALAPSESTDG